MNLELNNLIQRASSENQEKIKTDLDGFRQLFDRFVTEPGPSVIWEKIEKLPCDSVIINSNLISSVLFSLNYRFVITKICRHVKKCQLEKLNKCWTNLSSLN